MISDVLHDAYEQIRLYQAEHPDYDPLRVEIGNVLAVMNGLRLYLDMSPSVTGELRDLHERVRGLIADLDISELVKVMALVKQKAEELRSGENKDVSDVAVVIEPAVDVDDDLGDEDKPFVIMSIDGKFWKDGGWVESEDDAERWATEGEAQEELLGLFETTGNPHMRVYDTDTGEALE